MSSYNHAAYHPIVWYLSSPMFALHVSDSQGASHHPVMGHTSGSGPLCTDAEQSGLSCNIHPHIMTKEHSDSEKSDSKNRIADLVRSDDQFLDQLEVMHYLNFSDY